MKILYVITGLGLGGAEKVVVDLAEQMNGLGHEVRIAYLKGEAIVKPKSSDIGLIALGLEGVSQAISASKKYRALVKEFKPDVVHAHMIHANIFTRVLRKFIITPRLICTAHSNNEGGHFRMLAYKLTHSLSDLTTNVSQSAAKSFERFGAVPNGGIQTVYNGINLNKFKYNSTLSKKIKNELNVDKNTTLFLAVGRMHEAKDYPNLLYSFFNLKESLNGERRIKLIIAGDGHLKLKIKQLISELKLDEDVLLLGSRDDISSLMSAADVFVLSSSFEGFGLVVAEAMACECFVVATDCGGVKEVMGGSGILVSSKNTIQLTDALQKILKMDCSEIELNNQKALEHVRLNFDLNLITRQWLKIYETK